MYAVEGKKQKASKLQRLSSLQESSDLATEKLTPDLSASEAAVGTNSTSVLPKTAKPESSMPSATTVVIVTQNRHVKKAKLLAEHRKSAECATSGVKVKKKSSWIIKSCIVGLFCNHCLESGNLSSD